MDIRFLIGKNTDIRDIVKNEEIPLKTRLEFVSAYKCNNNTQFCKTNFGYTMLSNNEILIDKNQLNFEKTK